MSRIIAGRFGGARLAGVPGQATRPTTDRVREAVFSALAVWNGSASAPASQQLDGVAFVDLFAGTGAVGIEAASRGASPVELIDNSRRACTVAERNVATAGADARVLCCPVDSYAPRQSIDVCWLDPPYDVPTSRLDRLVTKVVDDRWLSDGGLVVAERSARSVPISWPEAFAETWTKRYGETVVEFAIFREGDKTCPS